MCVCVYVRVFGHVIRISHTPPPLPHPIETNNNYTHKPREYSDLFDDKTHKCEQLYRSELAMKREHEEIMQKRNIVMEYRALIVVFTISVIYICTCVLLVLLLWAASFSESIDTAPGFDGRNVSNFWFAIFTGVSAFNGAGLSLLNSSLTQVATKYGVLFLISLLMMLGTTLYPIIMRVIFIYLYHFQRKPVYHYILTHSRSISPYLFNGAQTGTNPPWL